MAGALSSASDDFTLKAIAILGGAVVVGFGIYELIIYLSQPPGGPCDSPSSPCYQTIQPFKALFNQCAAEQAAQFQQIIQMNGAPTATQEQTLQTLTDCMTNAATKEAQALIPYTQTPISTLSQNISQGIEAAVIIIGVGVGAAAALRALRLPAKTGAGANNNIKNAITIAEVNAGNVTAAEVPGLEAYINSYTSANQQTNATLLNEYATAGVIDAFEAQTLIQSDNAAMAADQATVINLFAGLPARAGPRMSLGSNPFAFG